MNHTIGLLHSGIREDERMIITRAKEKGVRIEPIDIRKVVFGPATKQAFKQYHVLLQRCIASTKADQVLWFFEETGIPVINTREVSEICRNKYATSMRLSERGVPTPRFALVFSEESAYDAIENSIGFPCVIKPISNTSWGRLMGKINDRDALEMILEHKQALGTGHQSFYLQEYIEKPQRDIRVYVADSDTYAAIYRESEHWIANTARGASAKPCVITPDIAQICKQTQEAIGSGLLALDLFETKDGLLVNEVNHTMEFKNVVKVTGIDIPGRVIDYCLDVVNQR